ncbi:MAG TPA: hypothetical protein VLM89_08995 [Phycisphaerae bacterium]|nr:hypothetical protein [Phycisphaerae bacterium]
MPDTHRHKLQFIRRHNGRRAVRAPVLPAAPGRLPRVSRLMALAIRFEHLLQTGGVRDQAELAALGRVTRARVTQILNLLHLAPDLQEQILFLPPYTTGRDPLPERLVRAVVAEPNWGRQRLMWAGLRNSITALRAVG